MRNDDPNPAQEPQLPAELREALLRLHAPPTAVPPETDLAILGEARRSFVRRRRRWLVLRRVGAAVAAAAVLAIAVKIFAPQHTRPAPVASSQQPRELNLVADVNHDGRVDIVDALIVAQRIARHERLDPAWDLNGDGVVDQKDVDLIANMAVHVSDGQVAK